LTHKPPRIRVRRTTEADFPGIIALCKRVYPGSPPWTEVQLASHLRIFPEGQFVAEDVETHEIVGMAASLIVRWDDYESSGTWREFTDAGMFTNHDPENGRTLYGAEVMVDPARQRTGIGAALYKARRELTQRLGLLRIRAAGRLRGYHRHADRMSAEEYVRNVARGTLKGPTLSFQLREGFRVIQVVPNYLQHDPESHGNAVVIEWLNPALSDLHGAPAPGIGRDATPC